MRHAEDAVKGPHVDHVTDDLTAFLEAVLLERWQNPPTRRCSAHSEGVPVRGLRYRRSARTTWWPLEPDPGHAGEGTDTAHFPKMRTATRWCPGFLLFS